MTRTLLTLLALGQVALAGDDAMTRAKRLNSEGYGHYKAGRYAEAIASFKEASRTDGQLALAHYNLACTLGVVRKRREVCDYEAYKSTVLDHLERAVALDEGRRKRMKEDPDLDTVRDTFRYQKLLGLSPQKPDELRKILVAVTWYGPDVSMGSARRIRFTPDGKVSVNDAAGRSEGTWKLSGATIVLTLGGGPVRGHLEPDGRLKFDRLLDVYSDDPDECSA